jgi:hypothetical protein
MRVTPYFNGMSRQDAAEGTGDLLVRSGIDLVIEALDEFAPASNGRASGWCLCDTAADYVSGAVAHN